MRIAYLGLILFFLFVFFQPATFFPVLAEIRAHFVIAWITLIFAAIAGRRPARNAQTWLFLLIVSFIILSIYASPIPGKITKETGFQYFFVFLKCIAVYFLVTMVVTSERELTRLLTWIVLMSFVVGTISLITRQAGIMPLGGSKQHFIEGRLLNYFGGVGSESNEFAALMLLLFPIPIFIMEDKQSVLKKLVFCSISFIFLLCVFGSGSRGAVLALGGILFFLLKEYRKKVGYIIIISSVVFVAFYQVSAEMIERFSVLTSPETALQDATASSRIREMQYSWELIKTSPLTGLGLGNYRRGKVYILGFDSDSREADLVSHNTYLIFGVEMGLPTMILFLLVILYSYRDFTYSERIFREREDTRKLYLLVKGIKIGFIGFLIAIFFLPEIYNIFFYLWVAVSVSSRKIAESFSHVMEKDIVHQPS